MPLVEIARFSELHEGHIAAGALVSSGIPAWFPGHGYGAVDWTMRQAAGGFPLYVDEAAVLDAREFLAEVRKPNPEALQWNRHPALLTGIPLAVLGALIPDFGMAIAAGRRGPGWRVVTAVVFCVAMTVMGVVIVVSAMNPAEY